VYINFWKLGWYFLCKRPLSKLGWAPALLGEFSAPHVIDFNAECMYVHLGKQTKLSYMKKACSSCLLVDSWKRVLTVRRRNILFRTGFVNWHKTVAWKTCVKQRLLWLKGLEESFFNSPRLAPTEKFAPTQWWRQRQFRAYHRRQFFPRRQLCFKKMASGVSVIIMIFYYFDQFSAILTNFRRKNCQFSWKPKFRSLCIYM
jgi:hypothetical protein